MIAAAAAKPSFKSFGFPKIIIARFTAMRSSKSAAIWGLVFGISTLSSITGFNTLYKTAASKEQLVHSFGDNAGLNALFGLPNKLDTAGGFTAWRMLGIAMLIGSIWGLLTATKTFRGEEEAGRWEMFLCGQTSSAKAAANALVGLLVALLPFILLPTIFVYIGGQTGGLHYSFASALFFGVTIASSAALFMSVGALMSQIAPIRRRAAMYSALIFGVSFLIRAAGDATPSLNWLTNFSPLGWVEKLHPLSGSDAIWLLPISVFILSLSLAAIYLAGRRDLNDSLLADKDSAKARTKLLNSPFGLTVRLEKNAILGWVVGAGFVGLLYGGIAKSATDVLKDSSGAGKAISKIAGETQVKGVETFMGVVFLLLMVVIMIQVTNLIGAIRSEEADGHLDNLLVRPVSRLGWLGGRLVVVSFSLLASVVAGTFLAWIAIKSQDINLPFHEMWLAGINILPTEIFIMGAGILALGFKPRLTSVAMYSVIAWSFLMEMIGRLLILTIIY